MPNQSLGPTPKAFASKRAFSLGPCRNGFENAKSTETLEITREKGIWRFILEAGLGWGAFMFVLNLLMGCPQPYSILVSLCISLVGGVILAVSLWVVSERRYRQYVDHEVEPHDA